MFTIKSKTYNVIPLSEVKQDLRIVATDTTYDAELTRLLRSSISAIEKRIAGDIVPTVNQLEDYNLQCSCYTVFEPGITITGITIYNDLLTSPTTSQITGYTIQKGNQYTLIKFANWVNAEKISIGYTSGYSSIPDDLKRAIIMLTSQYLDIDKSGYVQNYTETKAIERLITPYSNILY
jgi:hypothetical protein